MGKLKKPQAFLLQNKTIILEKVGEAFSSVLPITLIILILCFTVTPLPSGIFLALVFGSFLLVIGMGLFSLGADTAMTPMGEYVSTKLMGTKKLWLIIPVNLILGILITVSEPDLQVLAAQVTSVDSFILMLFVGVGVGIFLVCAILRILFRIKLKYVLLVFYAITFILAIFTPNSFIAISFDSGGVTTGPMSVPFILAIGTGVAALRVDNNADNDGFGLTALCSIGPIIAVMLLGIIFKINDIDYVPPTMLNIVDSQDMIVSLFKKLPIYLKEVGISLAPILIVFIIFSLTPPKIEVIKFRKILIGLLYTYFGLVIFLTGVNYGFLSAGAEIGNIIGSKPFSWIIIPLGFIIGFFVVAAEPSVHVLTKQVEEVTSGNISRKQLQLSLMIGVGLSIALSMIRIYFDINIMFFLIPGYIIAIILAFIVPDIFSGIAFDSGGVASGTMTSSFILPMTLGFTAAFGRDVSLSGFGVVAFVAMTPIITIQILGLIYKIKIIRIRKSREVNITGTEDIIS